jgi:hypothetical protein
MYEGRLLCAQGFGGVDGGGATGRQKGAGEREQGQDADGREERERVALRGVDELTLREMGRGESER